MKTTFKVATSIFALGLVILVGLHLVMLYGLTKAMREVVLPRVKEETGIDVRVGRLSINMASGLLFLKEVEIRNPDGFLLENLASVDRVEIAVEIPSLFRQKPLRVKNVEMENAVVNVIRNKAGEINIDRLRELSQPVPAPDRPVPGAGSSTEGSVPESLPEMLVEAMDCRIKVRYLDFRLDGLDMALNLNLIGQGLSTQSDPATPWGELALIGSLGDDRTSFVTDLRMKLAPVTDPDSLSFDLTGKVLEIDPRIMEEAYSRMGIRSAPFGFDPRLHCREGWFEDSSLALDLREIQLEDKLADRLGGMGSIGSLRFAVPVEGSLQEPSIDVQTALLAAFGGNTQSLLDAFLKGIASKEAGSDDPPETLSGAVVEILGEHVEEIGESETAKKILKDLAGGEPSATNAPSPFGSDVLIDILGEEVDEIGENEALKEDLKNLGRKLFGK